MKLIDHINVYFGTEFDTMPEFIKDFKKGDLSDDYESADEALTHLLMFLNSLSKSL